MRRNVTAGIDGSAAAVAACEWAAREAELHGVSLRLLHAVAPLPGRATVTTPTDPAPRPRTAARVGPEAEDRIRDEFPDLQVVTDEIAARPVDALVSTAEDTEMLVLGSHGAGAVSQTLLGSVGRGVAGRATCPVVLVPEDAGSAENSAGRSTEGHTPSGDVVLGLDLDRTGDRAIGFAFDEAAARGGSLRVVHGRSGQNAGGRSGEGEGADQQGAVRSEDEFATQVESWRAKYPTVQVVSEAADGAADRHLAHAATSASLVVLGRGSRGGAGGLGTVAHAVLRSGAAPVAVVP
ncbi:universal stress protein [Streptomyces sp. NBC_00669]|uniref:universal stress protein n=1 Tax=Streptomyces sp. NBC_00669 TaxID=2976011 RepID=UPI002E32927C|nr:universal stress protein [Streptomyces sp. NBC_00669]